MFNTKFISCSTNRYHLCLSQEAQSLGVRQCGLVEAAAVHIGSSDDGGCASGRLALLGYREVHHAWRWWRWRIGQRVAGASRCGPIASAGVFHSTAV